MSACSPVNSLRAGTGGKPGLYFTGSPCPIMGTSNCGGSLLCQIPLHLTKMIKATLRRKPRPPRRRHQRECPRLPLRLRATLRRLPHPPKHHRQKECLRLSHRPRAMVRRQEALRKLPRPQATPIPRPPIPAIRRPASPHQAIPDPIHRLPRKRRWGPGPSPPSSWPGSSSWAP